MPWVRIDGDELRVDEARIAWTPAACAGTDGIAFWLRASGGRSVMHLAGWAPGQGATDLDGNGTVVASSEADRRSLLPGRDIGEQAGFFGVVPIDGRDFFVGAWLREVRGRPYVLQLARSDRFELLAREAVTPAINNTVVLLGGLMMITRRNLISQVIGLLSLENGLILAAVGVAGMPLVMELSTAALVLMLAVIAGVFALQMGERFQSLDTESLDTHRGEGE